MKLRKLLVLLMAFVMTGSLLSGCGKNSSEESKEAAEGPADASDTEEKPYVVTIYAPYTATTEDTELVAQEISKITKPLINCEVELVRDVNVEQINLALSSGEKLDLFYAFPWELSLSSMAANNTSSFNYRPIDDGSGRLSLHSYGLAIDINPLYNPYVREMSGKQVTSPEEGSRYADRSLDNEYYIKKGDIVYEAFISRGFTWGGDWKNSKDYQHFQKKTD